MKITLETVMEALLVVCVSVAFVAWVRLFEMLLSK
jgi:hypothetical protein